MQQARKRESGEEEGSAARARWQRLRRAVRSGRIYGFRDANRALRYELHKISAYRQIISIFSVPLTDQVTPTPALNTPCTPLTTCSA